MPLCAHKFFNYLINIHNCQIANRDKEWMKSKHFVHHSKETEAFIFPSGKFIEAEAIIRACNSLNLPYPSFKDMEC
jgi:hypothetical protein